MSDKYDGFRNKWIARCLFVIALFTTLVLIQEIFKVFE